MIVYKLMVDLPFLAKGNQYTFDDEGYVYRVGVDGKPFEYPLRAGLAGYLWLLMTEKKYLKKMVNTGD